MVLAQKWPFFQLFFRQYKPGKCLLRYSTKKENAFKTRKRKFSESLTNGSFLKGLVHGFGQKIELFLCIFFGQIKQEKILFLYSDEKSKLLIPEKLSFKKV